MEWETLGLKRNGVVEGTAVRDIILDTGCMAVLLGVDVPEMSSLLLSRATHPETGHSDAFVTTRAGVRRRVEEEKRESIRNEFSGARPTPVLAEQTWELGTELDDAILQGGKQRSTQTRSQKRQNRLEHRLKVCSDPSVGDSLPEMSAEELRVMQEADPTLKTLRNTVGKDQSKDGVNFKLRNGRLLYRVVVPLGKGTDAVEAREQLVLPVNCRRVVMELAHSIPLAGHLGKHKTVDRTLQRFYWPTLRKDVAEFCKCCQTCQKSSKAKPQRAPLIPLPILEEPFKRIAMDIVGPLPRSRSGNRYVLVICDYATRYPEAVAMRTIDAENVAEELVKLFARVGIPSEILTDQGSNFTSKLLTELYRLLCVHPIRTTPYHPQTDGLVERFNQTLKAMLRKAAVQEGKDWDRLIPYVLFAYREVPQSSTGFSPFELLYGR